MQFWLMSLRPFHPFQLRGMLFLLAVVLLLWSDCSDGRIVVGKGAKNVLGTNYANNLCPYTQAVYNGTKSPYFALQGLTISVAVNPDAPLFSFTFNKTTPNGGFLYTLVNTIAARGGFAVQWVVTPAYNSYSSGTTYMTSILPYVDIYGNVASDTVARRAVGIGFTDGTVRVYTLSLPHSSLMNVPYTRSPLTTRHTSLVLITHHLHSTHPPLVHFSPPPPAGVYDNSIVLVAIQSTAIQDLALWNFLSPFTGTMWAACCGVIVSYALLRYGLARIDAWLDDKRATATASPSDVAADADKLRQSPSPVPTGSLLFHLYHALGDFVQIPAAGYTLPKTCASMLLKFGYSFFVLIILASYTANLASDLVTAKRAAYSVDSMASANAQGQTICYLASNSASATTLTGYPKVKQQSISVVTDPQITLLRALKAGQCDGAVLYKTDWLAVQESKAANPDCDLVQRGDSLRPFDGSFAYNLDFSSKCTALVETTFSTILNAMMSDGAYDNLLQQRMAATADETCPAFNPTAGTAQLSFSLLAGIYTVFGATSGLAMVVLVVSVVGAWVRRREGCRRGSVSGSGAGAGYGVSEGWGVNLNGNGHGLRSGSGSGSGFGFEESGPIKPLRRDQANELIMDDIPLFDVPSYARPLAGSSQPGRNKKLNPITSQQKAMR